MPPVSANVISPLVKASIAQPMVAPTAIGSIPSWLQIWFASAIRSRSETMQ
jgi:hypothetical protein